MRLEVTRKSDLAVRVLRELAARPGARLKSQVLADAVGSTAGFVGQVMPPLVDAGWVASEPGPHGGYTLAAELTEISVLAVIEAIEGITDAGRCVLDHERSCADEGHCALHVAWTHARADLMRSLAAVSVAAADLAT